MENLIALAKLISKQKVVKIEVIGNESLSNSKLSQLYDGIIKGIYQNENDASLSLYGSEPTNPNFKKLKYRLQERLINTLLFIDVNKPNFKDTQRAYYSCQRVLSAVNILFGFSIREPAIEMAERAIKKAIRFDYTEIVLSLSRRLSRHYGAIEGDLKKFNYYKNITREYLKIYNAEVLASDYYNELAIFNTNSIGFQDNQIMSKRASDYSKELEEYLPEINTYSFILFTYSVFWFKHIIKGEYHKALKLCSEAIDKTESNDKYPPTLSFLFYSRMLTCYTQLNNFKEGREAFQNALKYVNKGASNWFIIHRNYFLLAFRAKEYPKIYSILQQVKDHEKYDKMPRNIRELWNLNEAYVHFFISINKIKVQVDLGGEKVQKFKLNKFLNEVPLFSKDKRGINISILIIQLLFLLQQKKYGIVIDKVETLNAYCYRYLKKDNTFRSNCFIKLLLLLPKCDFHRVAVERKSKKILTKLQSVPLEVARQSAEIEIVPYEDLWEIVLDMLDMKFHIPKNKKAPSN